MTFFSWDQAAALKGATVRIGHLAEFRFASKTMYVWEGNQELISGGRTWQPLFGAVTIDGLGVSGGTVSEAVTFGTIQGLPIEPNFLAVALAETPDLVQQMVIVYLQLMTENWQPQGSPIAVFWGFLQPPKIQFNPMTETVGGVQAITMTAENAFFNRSRPSYGRFTDRDQQARHPGDTFFSFVPSLLFKTITWPDF